MKICNTCEVPKSESEFYTTSGPRGGKPRSECKECTREKQRERDRDPSGIVAQVMAGGEALSQFGEPIERASAHALLTCGSLVEAAASVQLTPNAMRAHLSELLRRAATRGWSPASDMTKTTPEGYSVKGVSSYYGRGPDGEPVLKGQWVKTRRDQDHEITALLEAVSRIAEPFRGAADPVQTPTHLDDDLLALYPMGDPHLGMYAWAAECGESFDVEIAERNLVAAVDHLVDLAPRARQALIVNLGDFFHADNSQSTTTAGTRLDTDTRWAKVLSIGVRTMRRCIDRALEKHERVRVVCEIGNHDQHSSLMLAIALSQFYERESRVEVDTSPAKFHWHRFGSTLIGITHGDTVKARDLPGVMACDRAKDWGETEYRYWLCGHVHHDQLKEYAGCTVETFRTMAPKDSWHSAAGYRAGQDMKMDVIHRRWGRIQRHVVGIRQIVCAE